MTGLILAATFFGVYLAITGWHIFRSLRYSLFYRTVAPNNYWVKAAEVIFLLVAPLLGFIRYQAFETTGEIVFSSTHLPTLITMAALGGASFWVSKLFKYDAPPWLTILIPLGLIQAIILNIVLAIHFGKYIFIGMVFPLHGFELVAPLLNITLLSRELYHHHLVFRHHVKNEPIYSRNYLVLSLFFFMDTSFMSKLRICLTLFVPMLLLQVMILTLFGQSPDAIVQVFTDTKGFTFSNPGKRTVELFYSLLK